MRSCVMCNAPLTGRIDQFLCSNRCAVARFRLKEKTVEEFKDILLTIKSKDVLDGLLHDLAKMQLEETTNTY